MKTYLLITTTNSQTDGWEILEKGSKQECFEALSSLQSNGDVYTQTRYKNAIVVSKTTALREKMLHIDEV
jgi:hypothetical protein